MNSKYVKLQGDTLNGEEGVFYYEVQNDLIVRQICVVDDRIYWADEQSEADEEYPITDKPEFAESEIPIELGLKTISKEEFEAVWQRGKERLP